MELVMLSLTIITFLLSMTAGAFAWGIARRELTQSHKSGQIVPPRREDSITHTTVLRRRKLNHSNDMRLRGRRVPEAYPPNPENQVISCRADNARLIGYFEGQED